MCVLFKGDFEKAYTLFFFKANVKSVFNIKTTLNFFELSSGFKVNFIKSKIGGLGSSR